MARSNPHKTGPYGALPTKNGEGAIGTHTCKICKGSVIVKINKSGWPYAFCVTADCKNQIKTQGRESAARLIREIDNWHEPARKPAMALAQAYDPKPVNMDNVKKGTFGKEGGGKPKPEPVADPPPTEPAPAPLNETSKDEMWYDQ